MKLTRKNLLLDAEKLHGLAERHGVSESAMVRELIDNAWFADQLEDALIELKASGFAQDGDDVQVSFDEEFNETESMAAHG